MTTRQRHPESGFALLEALVALALAALLIGSVMQAVRWVSTVSAFGNRVARVAEIEAGSAAITDLLASAIAGPAGASFVGDARGFTFDMISDGTALASGPVRASLAWRPGPGAGDLAGTFVGSGVDARPTTTSLLPDLASVRFSYFGQDEPDKPRTWRGEWTSKLTMPSLVLIETENLTNGLIIKLPLYSRVGRTGGIAAGRP